MKWTDRIGGVLLALAIALSFIVVFADALEVLK